MTSIPKIAFASLGCPKNTFDSERILTQLRAEGYLIVPTYQDADLVVVNTCGFIDAAVEESLDAIGEALRENGKGIVTGCLGARESARSVRRSGAARRHEIDAASLCLPEDFRRLQSPLHLLHHPQPARRSGFAAHRRCAD